MARLTRYEQETIINFNEEEATANVYTYNKALQRKLAQLAQERPQECILDEARDYGGALVYDIPKRWVKIIPNRILSEEEKERKIQALRKGVFCKESPCQLGKTEHAPISEGNYTSGMGEGENTP